VDNLSALGNRKLGLTITSGTLYLSGNNSNTGPTRVTGGILGGNGSLLSPVTVEAGGTLSAGTSIGRLGITNSLTFLAGSTNFVEVNTDSGTNDWVAGLTSVTYGGTLVITNLGSSAITTANTFRLFSASAYSGIFNIVPEFPASGLFWDTSTLTTDGILRVRGEAAPAITSYGLLPDNNFGLTLTGTLGQPYHVWVTSDVSQPLNLWTVLTNGNIPSVPFLFEDLTATNQAQRYYIISTP